MKWAYPPKNGQNQGYWCYYCARVHKARHALAGKSFEDCEKNLGQDEAEHEEFMEMRVEIVDKMKSEGRYDVVIRKGPGKNNVKSKEMSLENSKKVEIFEPEDEMYLLADYVREHGHPTKNGKGHKQVQYQGKDMVLIPAKKVWKVKRSDLMQGSVKSTFDHGDVELYDGMLEDVMEDIFSDFMPDQATGMTMDELLHLQSDGGGQPASSSSAPTPMPSPTRARAHLSCRQTQANAQILQARLVKRL